MKEGKTINGKIYMIDNVITEENNNGNVEILTFPSKEAALQFFNRRRIVKKGAPRLHRREIATIYYSQTIICL